MKMLVIGCLLCSILLAPSVSDARTWLVTKDGSGNCTTIQACCDSAAAGDTVLVGAGVYAEHVRVLPGITMISEGGPLAAAITLPSTLEPILRVFGATVDGFTIRGTNWVVLDLCGGVEVWGGVFRNCLVVNCKSSGIDSPSYAGGLYVSGSAVIESNTIVSNGYFADAGGIFCRSDFDGTIERNIVAQSPQGYGIYCETGASPTFICNNVWGNAGGEYGGACTDPTGTGGNISADPLFCAPVVDDFYLRADSPCLNAPGCGLIGALGQGCPPVSVEEGTTWGRIKATFR